MCLEKSFGSEEISNSNDKSFLKQSRRLPGYGDENKFGTSKTQHEVMRGIAELEDQLNEYQLRRIKLKKNSSENLGFLYFASVDKTKEGKKQRRGLQIFRRTPKRLQNEGVCVAYTDLERTMLVRLGDEVVFSRFGEVGFIVDIEYSPNFFNEVFCIIDLGEDTERLVEISPSEISINYTLLSENRTSN